MSLILKTPADANNPLISLDEVKDFLRVESDVDDEDTLIKMLRDSVLHHVQQYTNRSVGLQVWLEYFDDFCSSMKLERTPVKSIVGVKYYDSDGALQTASPSLYLGVLTSTPARVELVEGEAWPTVQDRKNAVEVEYEAGYETAEDIPAWLKLWIFRAIGFLYENRQGVEVPPALMGELFSYSVHV